MARLTLTFDNGPSPGTTEEVLETLDARSVRATFFVVGSQVRNAPELVFRAWDEAHWIGNHSMTHAVPLGLGGDPALEIDGAQELIGAMAHADRLFRPFGGGGVLGPHLFSAAAVDRLAGGAYTVVLWNSVPRDWEDPAGWVTRALADVADREWTVVVLHDVPTGAMASLGEFIDRARDAGVEVVQEFPDACVPVRRGVVFGSLDGLIAPR